ncbi:subtilisin-like protease SBT1.4 [Magnolia sinica]|uniref:subtilisin-like protease SBT1.4 n=1 Tax=Magnolia sinica TaxID=86752 RepID=UPI002658C864|nr:subtilisin-like protease SBT1.4 [Magnolia sinica]
MGNSSIFLFLLLSLISTVHSHDHHSTYIVHVSKSQKPAIFMTHHHWYSSTLMTLPQSPHPTKILYTYDHAIHGFAARLTPSQAAALQDLPGILSVQSEQIHHLDTTHTPTFLGLADISGLWPNSDYADDIIIGLLDTGIWPERRSFSDAGLTPVPDSWKGLCQTGPDFPATACNRKLIGAKAYYAGYEEYLEGKMDETVESRSPRDTKGHGTHTASTAAGAAVTGAGFYNLSVGEARGMATKARIAAYKICWLEGCFDSDILAAMDQAVSDGVHVISLSVSLDFPAQSYDKEAIAIGSFGAVQRGVLVSASAGNDGPIPSSVMNIAPWILTVGASTVDREFPADVVLGDGTTYSGVSLYGGDPLGSSNLPLINGASCMRFTPSTVKGKIVFCSDDGDGKVIEKGVKVQQAGGAGMIMVDSYNELPTAEKHVLPATNVGKTAGASIRKYIRSEKSPTATIVFKGTVISTSPASPKVARFSSRGPTKIVPEILKPDVIAPGVNILASWTGFTSPTGQEIDTRRVEFSIESGTSMACPHVSGLAALVRKARPQWTPAAIKSALMTTSYNVDNSGKNFEDLGTGAESTPFIHGAGHVDPNKALNPGLIYDITPDDYVAFLCAIGYGPNQISLFVKDKATTDCSAKSMASPGDLNYPSFSVVFKSNRDVVQRRRVVTNVGVAGSVYVANITGPSTVQISVSPSKLVFSAQNQSLSYVITFASIADPTASTGFGSITWIDGAHVVRSPIAITWSPSSVSSI